MAKHPYAKGLQIIFIPSAVPANFNLVLLLISQGGIVFTVLDCKGGKLLSQEVVQVLVSEKEQKKGEF